MLFLQSLVKSLKQHPQEVPIVNQATKRAMLQMTVCAVLWSTAGIFIKLIPWNALVIAGFRSLIAAGVILFYMLYKRQKLVFSKRTVCIACCLCSTFFCFLAANKLTTAANAIVLQYTGPIFLLLYQVLFQKKTFRVLDYLAVGLTLGGISLFFFDQLNAGSLLGNLIGVCAGAGFAGMFLTNEGVEEPVRMSGLLLGHLLTAILGIPFAFVSATPFSPTILACIFALGLLQLGIPYLLFALAAKHCPPLTASLIAALEPLLNPVWVFLFTGEAPGLWALIGGIIVIASVTLWCIWDAKKAHSAPIAPDR